MDRAVVVGERLELQPHTRLLRDQPVGAGADRLLHKPGRSELLVVFRRNHPAGAADVAGSQQDREVEERLLEMEADGAVVHQLDTLRPLAQHLAPGTAIVLVAPFDIGRRDRRAVVELGARAQPERGAFRVLGEVETFGQRRMIVAVRRGSS